MYGYVGGRQIYGMGVRVGVANFFLGQSISIFFFFDLILYIYVCPVGNKLNVMTINSVLVYISISIDETNLF